MAIIGICGDRGEGKTAYLAHLVLHWLKRNFHIVSNTPIEAWKYQLYSPADIIKYKTIGHKVINKAEIITDPHELFKAFVTYRDTIFVLDEAGVVLSNYAWDKIPDDVYHRFATVRKYNVHLLYTTQFFKGVAKKLRQQSDYAVICSGHLRRKADPNIPFDKGNPRMIRIIHYDKQFFEFTTYSLELEKRYIKRREFLFGLSLKETFESYDTLKDVTALKTE